MGKMLTPEERSRKIGEVRKQQQGGMTLDEACKHVGIAINSVYKWKKAGVKPKRIRNRSKGAQVHEIPLDRTAPGQLTVLMGSPQLIAETLRSLG